MDNDNLLTIFQNQLNTWKQYKNETDYKQMCETVVMLVKNGISTSVLNAIDYLICNSTKEIKQSGQRLLIGVDKYNNVVLTLPKFQGKL